LVILEVRLDSGKQVFLDLGGHKGSAFRKEFFNEVVKVDLFESFVPDEF